MSVPRSVAEVLNEHVTLEVEGIDRMYLNVYVPQLQREQGVATFFRFHRGFQFASSALMDPISKTFVAALEQFAKREQVPVIQFRKGERKDDVAAEQRKKFTKEEGVVFIGKAQEKMPVFRTEGGATKQPARPIPGWSARQRWSTSSISTAWTATSALSFSNSAATSPTQPSCVSTGMSMPSGNWRRRTSRSKPWTTEC